MTQQDPAPFFSDGQTTLYHGDVRTVLRALPKDSVHCVVTSPPYWSLRDYGVPPSIWGADPNCEHEWVSAGSSEGYTGTARWQHNANGRGEEQPTGKRLRGPVSRATRPEAWTQVAKGATCPVCGAWSGALGLEPSPEMFVAHLVEVLREVRRVLRKDGVVWLNLGDSYATGAGSARVAGGDQFGKSNAIVDSGDFPACQPTRMPIAGLKAGDLAGIPWRVALALQADGWWLRSDTVWSKPNPMPESVAGWRWERHRVKLAPSARAKPGSAHAEAPLTKPQGARDGHDFADHSTEWTDCPGCPACAPNGGLLLRRGSWRPTRSHEYLFMLARSPRYYGDGVPVREASVSGPSDIRKMVEGRDRLGGKTLESHDPLHKANRNTNIGRKRGVGDPTGRNRRSVWEDGAGPTLPRHRPVGGVPDHGGAPGAGAEVPGGGDGVTVYAAPVPLVEGQDYEVVLRCHGHEVVIEFTAGAGGLDPTPWEACPRCGLRFRLIPATGAVEVLSEGRQYRVTWAHD